MLFVVCGADCDHVGDIYECPQGTYAIGRRAPLQNNFIYTKTPTTKIFVIQTTNYSWSYIIATLWCIVCGFIQDFCLGGRGGGAPSVLRQVQHLLLRQWKTLLLLPYLRPLHNPSSQSLFTIGSVTAYTSGPSSTFW